MAIVDTVSNSHAFRVAFETMGRGNQFSYHGFDLLFDYLDELSNDMGENIELDPVSISCDYAEYTFDEYLKEAGSDHEDDPESDWDDRVQAIADYIGHSVAVQDEANDVIIVSG